MNIRNYVKGIGNAVLGRRNVSAADAVAKISDIMPDETPMLSGIMYFQILARKTASGKTVTKSLRHGQESSCGTIQYCRG